MKTIRMTAISTEKARSRTQESAFQTLVRARECGGAASGVGVGFCGILCYVIIDVLIGGSVARPPNGGRCARGDRPGGLSYFKSEPSTGIGTAPSLRARSLKSARLKALPLASLYSSRALIQARHPT